MFKTMVTIPLFDTHRTIERLIESGGFERKQAEAIADALGTALTGGVVTSGELRSEVSQLETWLTIRMGIALVVAIGLVGCAIAYATTLILSAIAA